MIATFRGSVEDHPSVRVYGRSPQELEALGIELEWSVCPLGGSRPWLVCPDCGRRSGVLYYTNFIRGDLACRICLGLIYPSTRERPLARLIRRAYVLRGRLGASGSLFDPLPGKPPGMRWRRYLRLRRRLEAYEECLNAAPGAWCARIEAWLDRRRARVPSKAD